MNRLSSSCEQMWLTTTLFVLLPLSPFSLLHQQTITPLSPPWLRPPSLQSLIPRFNASLSAQSSNLYLKPNHKVPIFTIPEVFTASLYWVTRLWLGPGEEETQQWGFSLVSRCFSFSVSLKNSLLSLLRPMWLLLLSTPFFKITPLELSFVPAPAFSTTPPPFLRI